MSGGWNKKVEATKCSYSLCQSLLLLLNSFSNADMVLIAFFLLFSTILLTGQSTSGEVLYRTSRVKLPPNIQDVNETNEEFPDLPARSHPSSDPSSDIHIIGGSDSDSDMDQKYSSWTPWTKCNKKCKQIRTRRCKSPAHCAGAVLREEKRCHGDKCKLTASNDHAQSGRTKSSFREISFHHFVYSEWSSWSSCSPSCEATRYKVCLFELFCGGHVLYEEAFCYQSGSICERIYLRRRHRTRKHRLEGSSVSFDFSPINVDTPNQDVQCGVPRVAASERSLRILGGQASPRGKWPWQVVILNRYKEAFCGGTLVAPSFVLTAAHCVRRRLYVRVGEHDLNAVDGSEEEVRVSVPYIHPSYDSETVDNDIALLKLASPVHYGDYVSPACIPHHATTPPVDRACVILGWGKEKHSDLFGSTILQEANVPIVSRNECLNVYEDYYISKNMFCAGYKRGRVDSCAGDSGGPLLCEIEKKWVVMGITSFGEGCGRREKYGIYTQVPNYAHWLHRIIRTQS